MTTTYRIGDGTKWIPLISTSGLMAADGGLKHGPVQGGASVVESYTCLLDSMSHEDAGNRLSELLDMLRRAREYDREAFQFKPIYIEAKTSEELRPRYAQVFGSQMIDVPDLYNRQFGETSFLDKVSFTVEREAFWRATPPGVLPAWLTGIAPQGPSGKNFAIVTNMRDNTDVTHVFNFDAAPTPTFSANLINATSVPFWSVGGSTPAAGDMIYIGAWEAWRHFYIPRLTTAGSFTADIIFEYWNGSAWTALTEGSTYALWPRDGEDTFLQGLSDWMVSVSPPADWASTTVNGVSAYWIRVRLNTVATWTTTPVGHASETFYTPRSDFIEAPASAWAGDAAPLLMFRMHALGGNASSSTLFNPSKILIGAKPRGDGLFHARLNPGGEHNPTGWAVSYGADTSAIVRPYGPGTRVASITFSTDSSLAMRVRITGTDRLSSYRGRYRAFAVIRQPTGAPGDVSIRLRVRLGGIATGWPLVDGETKYTVSTLMGEVIDLGNVRLPFVDIVDADKSAIDVIFELFAGRSGTTATLEIIQFILLPIDFWPCGVSDPVVDILTGASSFRSRTALDLDTGVVRERVARLFNKTGLGLESDVFPVDAWRREGSPLRHRPADAVRFYFLFLHYASGTWGARPWALRPGSAAFVQFTKTDRYALLRGSS